MQWCQRPSDKNWRFGGEVQHEVTEERRRPAPDCFSAKSIDWVDLEIPTEALIKYFSYNHASHGLASGLIAEGSKLSVHQSIRGTWEYHLFCCTCLKANLRACYLPASALLHSTLRIRAWRLEWMHRTTAMIFSHTRCSPGCSKLSLQSSICLHWLSITKSLRIWKPRTLRFVPRSKNTEKFSTTFW